MANHNTFAIYTGTGAQEFLFWQIPSCSPWDTHIQAWGERAESGSNLAPWSCFWITGLGNSQTMVQLLCWPQDYNGCLTWQRYRFPTRRTTHCPKIIGVKCECGTPLPKLMQWRFLHLGNLQGSEQQQRRGVSLSHSVTNRAGGHMQPFCISYFCGGPVVHWPVHCPRLDVMESIYFHQEPLQKKMCIHYLNGQTSLSIILKVAHINSYGDGIISIFKEGSPIHTIVSHVSYPDLSFKWGCCLVNQAVSAINKKQTHLPSEYRNEGPVLQSWGYSRTC